MATATLRVLEFGPSSAGTNMTPREFDRADFVDGWRYELIKGVLVVSPIPSENERDPNGELCYWLREYRDKHPQGRSLDATLFEQTVRTKQQRRRADRVIWAGLGRQPKKSDVPTIIAEFVSKGKRNRRRDYEEKRDEYHAIGVTEYWILDRFERTMTVYIFQGSRTKKLVLGEKEVYTTKLLPGFELPLARLFAQSNWPEEDE